jgi:transmembrane protein EpsG
MLIYILIAVALTFFAINGKIDPMPLFIVLWVIASVRAVSVGIDHQGFKQAYDYELSFYSVPDLLGKFEIGWIFLNKIVKTVFDDFSYVLWISSFLTLYPIYVVIKRDDTVPLFSLLLYFMLFFYCLSFSLIRQSIAVSFFLLAVHHFNSGERLKFIMAILVASLFHYSALVLLPLTLFCDRMELSYKTVVWSLAITFAIGFLGFTDSIRGLIQLLPFEKYSHYAEYNQGVEFDRLNLYIFLVPKILLFIYFYRSFEEEYDIYKNIFFAGLIISNLFLSISLVSRFVMYMSIMEIILIPGIIYFASERKRFNYTVIILIYAFVYFMYYLFTNRGGIVPYQV